MADTFLAAVAERYAGGTGFPTLWLGAIPEGVQTDFNQALLEHTGEQPVDYQSNGAGGIQETKNADGCRITLFGTVAEDLDTLARSVILRLAPNSLDIEDRRCAFYRRSYLLEKDPNRSVEGKMVFRAVLTYFAELDG